MSGENWYSHMLRLVGSWVAKGNTDDEIHVLTAAHTLPGYTAEQTYAEVQKMGGQRWDTSSLIKRFKK